MAQLKWIILFSGLLGILLLIMTINLNKFSKIPLVLGNRPSTTSLKSALSDRLVLMVRTCKAKAEIMRTMLLHSLLTFWNPDRFGHLIVILDQESLDDHNLGDQIEATYKWISVKYEDPTERIYHNHGHHRTQWSNFYCDKYTDKEFVGIVDTDSLLVTLPTENDFFLEW